VKHDGHFGEIKGRLQLSRTFTLKNRLLIRGTQAKAEISVQDPEAVVLHRTIAGKSVSETLRVEDYPPGNSYLRQLDNFVQSVVNRSKPEVDGWQAVRVMELIESCYAQRKRIPEPWAESKVARSEARA
jgi:predicted dehydrogenase